MERRKGVCRGRSRWVDLPPELLMSIFDRIPSWEAVSQACLGWQRAILSLPRPVVLHPVTDCPPPDPLPLAPVAVQLLVPTVVPPRGVVVSESINEAEGPFFRYLTVPIESIGSDMRLIGGSSGLPLFVDDCYSRLVILRLTSPQLAARIDSEIAMALDLPDGVDSEEVYIGGISVSRSSSDACCLPLGICAIMVATRSCLFGTRAAGRRQMWSMLEVTEPAEGRSFERQGLRTFVSILFDGQESAYLFDASQRLCLMNWNAAGGLQMQELPIQGGPNALLDGSIAGIKMVWLLKLPELQNRGTNLVYLGYRWFDRCRFGRFVAFDLVEDEARRVWAMRHNILGELCVLVSWGPGAVTVVYKRPEMIGLSRGRIYSCQDGLRSYILGWNYRDTLNVPSYWPFPLWIDPEFPNPLSLEDTLVKFIMEEPAQVLDSPDADMDDEEDDEAAGDAIGQVELSASSPVLKEWLPRAILLLQLPCPREWPWLQLRFQLHCWRDFSGVRFSS